MMIVLDSGESVGVYIFYSAAVRKLRCGTHLRRTASLQENNLLSELGKKTEAKW